MGGVTPQFLKTRPLIWLNKYFEIKATCAQKKVMEWARFESI